MTRTVTTGPGGVWDIGYHVVWCPAEHGRRIIALEVMPDHVHLFVKTRPKDSPSFVANQFKGFTSRMLRSEFPSLRSRLPTLWSRSYFVASVGAVSAETVKRYFDTQYERPWRKGN